MTRLTDDRPLPTPTKSVDSTSAADRSLGALERSMPRAASLDLILGAPALRCPVADRAVRIVRGGGR